MGRQLCRCSKCTCDIHPNYRNTRMEGSDHKKEDNSGAMIGGAYEDGEETKSDFLARMFMMGRIDIDPEAKTLKSNITCQDETGESKPALLPPPKPSSPASPIVPSCDKTEGCEEYNVMAKGFFSDDIALEPDGPSVKNEANFMADEWHHKYDVKFKVAATQDPKDFLSEFFEANVKQLGDAAVKISYVHTEKVTTL